MRFTHSTEMVERPRGSVRFVAGVPGLVEERLSGLHPVAAVLSAAVGGYVMVCLVFASIGVLITHELGALTGWDDDVSLWFAQNRTGVNNTWTNDATKVADTVGILLVLVASTTLLLLFRSRWEALFLGLALSLELTAFLTVNYLVGRPRPDVPRLGALPSTSSFPSGHTAATIAFYGGLAVLLNARVRSRVAGLVCWAVVFLTTTAIGVARVYRGMHHPSDVIVGALLGLAVLGVAIVAVRAGQLASARRQRVDQSVDGSWPDPKVVA